jgi:hypothetical protein
MRKIQAQLSSTSASVGSFNQKVGTEGVAGLGKLSSGFEHLARSALGFGRAEASIAVGFAESIGASLPILLGLSAAIGLSVEAFHYFEKAAKAADDAYNQFMQSLRKTTPLAIIGAELDVAKDRLADLEEKARTAGGLAIWGKQIDAATASVKMLQGQYDETIKGLDNTTGKMDAANKKGYEYVVGLTKQGYAINHTALEQKLFEIQLSDMPATYKKAAEAVAKLNDQLEKQKKWQEEIRKFGAGGNNVVEGDTTRTGTTPEQEKRMTDAANQGGGFIGQQAGIAQTDEGAKKLSGTLQTINDLLPTMADGFAMVFEQLGSGGFDAAAKSFGHFIGQVAAMEGKLLILKGLGKIADGIFPLIPGTGAALIASGVKMVAAGAAMEVFAGALGGGTQGSSGGAGGAGGGTTQSTSNNQQPLPSKGTLTISVPRHAYSGWSDPGFQEFIVQTIAGASGRGVRMVTR